MHMEVDFTTAMKAHIGSAPLNRGIFIKGNLLTQYPTSQFRVSVRLGGNPPVLDRLQPLKMPVGIEAWLTQIPPVTRAWLALSVLTSLAVQCQLVTPLQLYFSFKSAFTNAQPWRAATTFFYFGSISLDFVFHMFFFMRYSRMLEESSFANRTADYFWLLLTSSFMLLSLSPLVNLPFLSSSLAFVPIYLWSRRHPSTPISLFGLFTISAPYLPLALVAFSWIISGTWKAAAGDLLGCAVGHVGWFVRDVWSREMIGGPTFLSDAPDALKRLFGDI